MGRDLRSSDVKDLEIRHAADGTELIPCEFNGRDVYLTAAMIAAINTGSGLPPQWSEGGHGDVTATVDDVASTALTIEGLAGQTAALFAVVNALAANLFTVSPDGEVVATVDDPAKTPLTINGLQRQAGDLLKIVAVGNSAFAVDNFNEQDYFAIAAGSLGNGVTVSIVDNGPNQPLTVTDDAMGHVTVQLATDSGDVVTSTVGDVNAAITTYSIGGGIISALQHSNFVPSDIANVAGPFTLAGGREDGATEVLPGGVLKIVSGDPSRTALDVSGDTGGVQVADLFRVLCNGYGITVNKDGTLVMFNDQTDPSAQFWVNDGIDLGIEIDGTGVLRLFRPNNLRADVDMVNSELEFTLDDTPGATKMKIKAKDSAGTVRTGTLALS